MDSVRERLLDAAEALIYRNGIHATGTDAILKKSGTARMSLYNHFGSKDGLVVAALERRDERWMQWFGAEVSARGSDPREGILAMFDALRVWFAQPDFHGCAFINAAGEVFEEDHAVRAVARRHKTRLRAFILRLCIDANLAEPDSLARQLFLLVEGAIVAALVERGCSAATDAREAAAALLKTRMS